MTTKICTQCKETKLLELFVKNKTCIAGYASTCKLCSNAYKREWARDPVAYRKRLESKQKHNKTETRKISARRLALKKKYGMTLEDYQSLCQSQQNMCLICKQIHLQLVVDHDHNTNLVRGLLCRNCNSALGLFKEDVNTLKNAIDYVSKHFYKQ